MIKLVCKKCGKIWYTSNTKPNQVCSNCGGLLAEDNLLNTVNINDNNHLKIN